MARFDLALKGGSCVMPWGVERADIGIRAGRIAAIGDLTQADAAEVVDCKGLHLLPGLIDPHVHLRDPGDPKVETMETGTRAAVLGGLAAVFDMPNTMPSITNTERLDAKREYVITRPDTPLPWLNYLGQDEYFGVVTQTAGGYSFWKDAKLRRLTRYRYNNNDMADLETQLVAANAKGHRNKIIVTDGVFSMDGYVAQLDKIVALADQYNALVMIDECHAAGFIGKTGRGTPEYCGVHGKIDIVTGTLGKALGGAMGGYTTGKKEVIEMLRQRSRPYLFSNSLAPAIVGASLKVFEILSKNTSLRDKLEQNTLYFKDKIVAAGFDIKPGDSPIVPIMLYDAALSQQFANELLNEGVYAIGFFYPVVAKGQARIRTQISAAHTREDLDKAIAAFIKVGKKLNVI